MKILIKQGSIVNEIVDAIVNPANSFGYMGGGVAKVLKEVGGDIIEEEAIHLGPTPIGEACITTAGDLPAGFIIHAPTMQNPGEKTDSNKIKDSLYAALEMAEGHNYGKIAIPGMGTGVGEVPFEEAAEAMMQVIKSFKFYAIREIILKDIEEEMVEAWRKFL